MEVLNKIAEMSAADWQPIISEYLVKKEIGVYIFGALTILAVIVFIFGLLKIQDKDAKFFTLIISGLFAVVFLVFTLENYLSWQACIANPGVAIEAWLKNLNL